MIFWMLDIPLRPQDSGCQKSLSRQSLTCLVSRAVFRNSLLHFGQEKDSAGLSCSG